MEYSIDVGIGLAASPRRCRTTLTVLLDSSRRVTQHMRTHLKPILLFPIHAGWDGPSVPQRWSELVGLVLFLISLAQATFTSWQVVHSLIYFCLAANFFFEVLGQGWPPPSSPLISPLNLCDNCPSPLILFLFPLVLLH